MYTPFSSQVYTIGGGAAIFLALFLYFSTGGKSPSRSSRKARRAKEMREAFKSIQSNVDSSKKAATNKSDESLLQISQLWIYPIKSLRGCAVPNAMLTSEGFYHDRRFMLLKDHEETPRKLQNMHVPHFPAMCLFQTSINGETLTVSYRAPESKNTDTLDIPLEPETFENLEKVEVIMHLSPTTAYDMGNEYSEWFSERFGFKVILAFWGGNPRPVLGMRPGKPVNVGPKPKNAITNFLSSFPIFGSFIGDDEDNIAFNDCAPFLVINEASVGEVTTRLPDGVEMDLTKFRANIVLRGPITAFEEDFWGELTFGAARNGAKIILTGNCGRCASLNVDYSTGKIGTGKDGQVLKLLQKDRRVDKGVKYSPIFGRYGFPGKGDQGKVLSVGDAVAVSRKNEERTQFYWPGM